MPITVQQLATHRLGREAENGQDFEDANLAILGGCQGCRASLAAYNGYPTKTGYWQCKDCVEASGMGWDTVEEANQDIFGSDPVCT